MNILADTCFWISLCDSKEADHVETEQMMRKISGNSIHSILVPHPVLYETLRTEMVKRHNQVLLLHSFWGKVQKISDIDYIDEAYRLVERQAELQNGTASMVDMAIMLMARDVRNNVKAILTRNKRDFARFCQEREIILVENMATLNAI